MRNYIAGILNTEIDSSGNKYTLECLKGIVERSNSDLPVMLLQREVGTANNVRIQENEIVCDVQMKQDIGHLVPVIGYLYQHENPDTSMAINQIIMVVTDMAITPNTWIKELNDRQ